MPYPNQPTTKQPVPVTQVREQLEAAKRDPARILNFLEQAENSTDALMAANAHREKMDLLTVEVSGRASACARAYRWLFRNAAEYFASRGGFTELEKT